jgi:hypothetical protein
MHPSFLQYADHFLQEFGKWAKSKPIINGKDRATSIDFSVNHDAPEELKNAIKEIKPTLK